MLTHRMKGGLAIEDVEWAECCCWLSSELHGVCCVCVCVCVCVCMCLRVCECLCERVCLYLTLALPPNLTRSGVTFALMSHL